MIKKHYSTKEAARLTGFKTSMMVAYLCRQGIVVPTKRPEPGRGRTRLYSFGDLVVLRSVNRLLTSGLPVSRLSAALNELQRRFRRIEPETALTRYLITDGHSVFLADEPGKLVDLNQDGQIAFAFIVDIEHARKDVISATQQTKDRRQSA